jgi:ABC transport system ATP-binding/permease protein
MEASSRTEPDRYMSDHPPARSDQPLATFVGHQGPDEGQRMPVYTPVVRIGQGPQNDLVLDDDTVSTKHARLEFDAGSWVLTDLGSRNGTFVEGVRLAPEVPTPLSTDAVVAFGMVQMTFQPEQHADPESARERYAPPPPKVSLAERSTAGIPVWLVVLVVLVVLILIGLIVAFGGAPTTVEQIREPIGQLAPVETLRQAA